MNDFEITPYVGVGDLKFGASRSVAHAILGSPAHSRPSKFSKKVTDYWQSNQLQGIFAGDAEVLNEIVVSRELRDVKIDGVYIFRVDGPTIRAQLCARDGNPRIRGGAIFLFNFGIALSEFDNTDEDQRSVTIFARGVWDPSDSKFARYVPR